MYLSFALKIAFSNFLTEKEVFELLWPRILIICLVALKHRIGVLRSCKEVILHLSSKMTFFCKKAQTHENLSSALQKTVHFIRNNFFHVLGFALKIHLATFSH